MELDCSSGEILDALEPARGVGIDIGERMVEKDSTKFPHLKFPTGDTEDLQIGETFDYVLIVGLVNHLRDDFDPFGDFDLIFGAAKLNPKIVEITVRYRARTYLSTNMRRFARGWLLLKMVAFSLRKVKFK